MQSVGFEMNYSILLRTNVSERWLSLAMIDFEWDAVKAEANLQKHDVSFDEWRTVLSDPFLLTISDPDHSIGECEDLSAELKL